jgi:O-antigen/teichoic acid export membrane protein
MSKATFFRQSGWMMFATVAGGALMWLVHFLSKRIPESEYGTLVSLLAIAMLVPVGPLGAVFVQQTALALATGRKRQLTRMIRITLLALLALWLGAAVIVLLFQSTILQALQITNPGALWITMLVVLGSMGLPVFFGLLQGAQNFLWLGWGSIINGAGRVGAAAFIVLVLGGFAVGIMTGVCVGIAVTLTVCAWQTRPLWRGPSEPFDGRKLLAKVVPLALGFGAYQFLFTADTMFVKHYFTAEETGYYGLAGTLSRALVWVVGPLTAVMFPKIVHSAAKAEKTDLLGITLAGTALLAGGGALALWLLSPWLIPFIAKPSYVAVGVKLIPWYAAAMVPLTLTNVLLSNLLARGRFGVVPWLVGVGVAYVFALTRFHDSLVMVLQTVGVFGLLAFGVCAGFTWGKAAVSLGGCGEKSETRNLKSE